METTVNGEPSPAAVVDRIRREYLAANPGGKHAVRVIGGVAFSIEDIDHVVELQDVYDGYSVIVLKDGTRINRWASQHEANQAEYGREHRWSLTQRYLQGREEDG